MIPVPGDVVRLDIRLGDRWIETIYTDVHKHGVPIKSRDTMLVIASETYNSPLQLANLLVLTCQGFGWIFSNLVQEV